MLLLVVRVLFQNRRVRVFSCVKWNQNVKIILSAYSTVFYKKGGSTKAPEENYEGRVRNRMIFFAYFLLEI